MSEPSAGVASPTPTTEPPPEGLRLVAAQPNPFVGASKGFFPGGDRGRQLEELRHLSRWTRRLLAVTGERGAGKSTLFRALSGHLDTGVKAARINANLTSDVREVLAGVLQGFGVAVPARASVKLLAELVAVHVEEQAGARRQCLVLVDDAHLLELRALEQLLQLVDSTSEEALRVVLFAESSLIAALNRICRRMTNVRTWHEIRLSPLDEQDTRRFVQFRLADAGSPAASFSRAQLDLVWQQSLGVPGRINEVAAALHDGSLALVERGRLLPRGHRAIVWLLGAVMLSGWLVWTNWTHHAGEEATSAAQAPIEAGADERAVAALELPPGADASAGTPAAATPEARGAVAREVESADRLTTALAPGDATVAPGAGTEDVPVAGEPAGEPAPAVNAAAPPPAAPEAPAPSQATVPVAVPEAKPDRMEPIADAAKPADARPAAPERRPAPAATTTAPAEPPATPRGIEWVRARPRTHWTLQLFGTSNADTWRRYVAEHDRVAGFTTRRNGEPWYVVVYGDFETQAQAEDAARRLPASLGRVQPWVRSFGAIQESLGD